jgi:hypothetical protein
MLKAFAQGKFLIYFVVLIAAQIFFAQPAFAATTKCCPQEFSRCDGAVGEDRVVCLRHGHANIIPVPNWGDRNWCGNGDFSLGVLLTTDQIERSYDCDTATGVPVSGMSCNWTATDDGMHAFCASVDAPYREDLANARIAFGCVENCGGAGGRWIDAAFGSSTEQYITVGDENIQTFRDGRHYACFGGGFDSGVRTAIQDCLNDSGLACAAGAIPGAAIGFGVGGATGTMIVTVPVGALAGCAGGYEISQAIQSCVPKIMGRVSGGTAGACAGTFNIELREGDLVSDVSAAVSSYSVCAQIPVLSLDQIDTLVSRLQDPGQQEKMRSDLLDRRQRLLVEKRQCCECAGDVLDENTGQCSVASQDDSLACNAGLCQFEYEAKPVPGMYTAIGCIQTDSKSIVVYLVKTGLGIAGGIALLMILAGAFLVTTSAGEIKRLQQGKEIISSAVMGLFWIIFSVTILQFIGVTIFKLPGFG